MTIVYSRCGYFLTSVGLAVIASLFAPLLWASTFSIESIKIYANGSELKEGVSKDVDGKPSFIPQIEVSIKTSKELRSQNLFVHAYFYDSSKQLVKSSMAPDEARKNDPDNTGIDWKYRIPKILTANISEKVYFSLPDKIAEGWTVVVVFGNKKSAVAMVGPNGDEHDFSYPEQSLVQQSILSPNDDDASDDVIVPLIETKAASDNPLYPQFTLFLHLPHGITNPHDVKGVFAQCMLANSVQEIRDELNAIDPEHDPNPAYAFAESHQMAILAWGGKRGEQTIENFDEMDQDQLRASEESYQQLADAWDKAVQTLVDNYGIPGHDFLLNGWSAGGEWAARLAIRKPDRFLAVHIHVPTKYDPPTPQGSHVLWLLTSGELDPDDNRARKFYRMAKALNYPIIFKSFGGLGHDDYSSKVDDLEARFFEYALSLKRPVPSSVNQSTSASPPDFTAFTSPLFYGDDVNQDILPADQKNKILPNFLVALPTKEIAEAWNQ